MAFCSNCGAQNADNAQFCEKCGSQIAPQQTVYNQQQNQPVNNQKTPGKGLGIASLVCGIVSFFCFGFILGVLAVIFGGVAKSKGYKGGMATAGIVLGVIGLAFYVILFVFASDLLLLGLEL